MKKASITITITENENEELSLEYKAERGGSELLDLTLGALEKAVEVGLQQAVTNIGMAIAKRAKEKKHGVH